MIELWMACCLTCREEIVVSPPMQFGNVTIPEGSLCPNCLLRAELPQ